MGRLYAPNSATPPAGNGRLYATPPKPTSGVPILGPAIDRAKNIAKTPGTGPFPKVDQAVSQARNVIQAANAPFTKAAKYTGVPWLTDKLAKGGEKAAKILAAGTTAAVKAVLPKNQERVIQKVATAAVNPNSAVNRGVDSYVKSTFDPATRNGLGLVADVAEFAGNVTGTKEIAAATPRVTSELKTSALNRFLPPRQRAAIDALEADYYKWGGQTKTGVKNINRTDAKTQKLNAAGTQGKAPQRVLAESKVIPQTEGTKFRTADQAKEFRDSLVPLHEAERAAIRHVEQATPKIRLSDYEDRAVRAVRTRENIASGKANKLESQIRAEFADYRANYGDEVPLSVIDEIKSARYGDTRFDFTQPMKSDVNYAIGRAGREIVEETASKAGYEDLAQLNREIGDRLEAARYLESLDGQSLKYGKVGKYAFMAIGASAGRGLVGKVMGALGGELLADFLMKADVASPVKRLVLQSLQQTDPVAYEATLKWIRSQGLERDLRLALPPPRAIPMPGAPSRGATPGYPNYNPSGFDPSRR